MKSNSDVKEMPWKKITFVVVILLIAAGVSFAGWKILGKVPNRSLPPSESKSLIGKYLKDKTGKSEFQSSVDFSKERNPWNVLKAAYDAPPDYKSVYTSIGEHLSVAET